MSLPKASNAVSIEPPRASELPAICALLDAAELPSTDLGVDHLIHFRVARTADSDAIHGIVGLEAYSSVGLLRSLLVSPSHRNLGIGAALVDAQEMHAREHGIVELILLTTTAERFFMHLGYVVIPRSGAPTLLHATREFAALCPASAVCMRKRLRS